MVPTSLPAHGATDSGPEPDLDFSSNAHPLGPCPAVLQAMGRHDPTRYPDPAYSALRRRIAAFHHVDPDRVVIGAGAAELIHRMVRIGGGTVQHQTPGFGEYSHAAGCAGLTTAGFPSAELPDPAPGTVFLCLPNNPDGFCPSGESLEELAGRCTERGAHLVLDLAYLPFLESPPTLPASAIQLHAPNKCMGLVGVRAGYAVMPEASSGAPLRAGAPSWVVGTESVEFLGACVSREAQFWLEETTPLARRLRADLASVLRDRGFEVVESLATHMIARHPRFPESRALVSQLRERGVRVRDTTSMGLHGWIRLAARPQPEIASLSAILEDVLG